MRGVTWNRFPIKNLWLIPCLFHLWSEVTWIQICASLNHREKITTEPSRLISRKPIENLQRLFVACLCFIKVNVLQPSSVCSSTTATYISFSWFTYLCIPCYCDVCPRALRVGVKTLYTIESCEGRVIPCGLRVPALAGRVQGGRV